MNTEMISARLAALEEAAITQVIVSDHYIAGFAQNYADTLKTGRDLAAREGREADAAFIEILLDRLGEHFDLPANDG